MSCYDNDCNKPVNNPCEYDNCGCLHPSTFVCTTYTGASLKFVGNKGDDGNVILKKIDDKLVDLNANKGKVVIDANDSCPEFLLDKLEQGTNISFQVVGSGCDRKIKINSTTGGVPVDIYAKVSAQDTTSGYLNDKFDTGAAISKNVINQGAAEKIKFDINYTELLSKDSGNMLTIGSDGKVKTSFSTPDGSETKVIQGAGVQVSGSGKTGDPYVIATNPSIQAIRPCFDGVWRSVVAATISNASVVKTVDNVKYRVRHDGSIEFKGSMTFDVTFGDYKNATRKHTVNVATIPVTCLTTAEQAGTADLKSINYIVPPVASTDTNSQYGYIIRKSGDTVIIEFQSALSTGSKKTIVVNFDGAVSHPNI